MGFALPAHLPLERYIGRCLISPCPPPQFSPPPPLQPRKFQRQFYNSKTLLRNANGPPPPPDRASYPPNRSLKTNQRHGLFKEPEAVWVPLLAVQPFVKSKSNRTTKKNRKYGGDAPHEPDASEPPRMLHNRSQFSKLAVHTQGVPLIQSSRYEQSCKLKSGKAGNSFPRSAPLDSNKTASAQSRKDSAGSSGKTGESSSVNSDENLSCNSLENSLPRIIKPRKRRKKDRKPNGVPSAEQRAPDDNNNNTPKEDDCSKEATKKDGGQPGGSDKAPEDERAPESGNLDVAAKENESAEKGISCQCRYCDPSSVIWNVNTRSYSPSLVSCILPLGADHQRRSSGPVSLRGSGPPTPESHAKFPPFGAPLEAKTKMPPNDCRFPPPNFHRPPNEPYPFPYRGSPPYHNPPRIPTNSPSDRGGFAELYAAGKIGFPAPEQKLPEFTQRFGLLNVSNFHVPTGFIDTSRPPPPIPPKIEEPPPRIPNYAALVSNRRSWDGHDANGASVFRKNEAQLYQSSEFPSPEESSPKPASPWPVFNEEHRAVERATARTPEKVVVDESPSPLGSSPARSQNLEVSSEIVTSPNGHRDIEIKFFMTSSPAAPLAQPFMTFPSCAKVPDFTPSLKTGI